MQERNAFYDVVFLKPAIRPRLSLALKNVRTPRGCSFPERQKRYLLIIETASTDGLVQLRDKIAAARDLPLFVRQELHAISEQADELRAHVRIPVQYPQSHSDCPDGRRALLQVSRGGCWAVALPFPRGGLAL